MFSRFIALVLLAVFWPARAVTKRLRSTPTTNETLSYGHTLDRMEWWVHAGAPLPPTNTYVLFTGDDGGPNNIRIGWEMTGVVAKATGRTLVLPPAWDMYLLDWGPRSLLSQAGFGAGEHSTTTRVEDLINMAQLKANLPTLTWEQFSKREGIYDFHGATLQAAQVAEEGMCDLDAYKKVENNLLFLPGDGRREGFSCGEWWKLGGPNVDMRLRFTDAEWSLLTHGFMWHADAFRIAAKAVDFLGIFKYNALHARYNDFQFHDDQQRPEEILHGTEGLFAKDGMKLYLASDNPEKFKDIIKQTNLEVVTFKDMLEGPLKEMKSQYTDERWFKLMGPVEELICTYANIFVGSGKSSFSGHINRMRVHAKAPVITVLTHKDMGVSVADIEKEMRVWHEQDQMTHFKRLTKDMGDTFLFQRGKRAFW